VFAPPERDYPGYHCGEQNVMNFNAARIGVTLAKLPSVFNYQWWAHATMEGPAFICHFARPRGVSDSMRLRAMQTRAETLPRMGLGFWPTCKSRLQGEPA
jgi:hypothetical protein